VIVHSQLNHRGSLLWREYARRKKTTAVQPALAARVIEFGKDGCCGEWQISKRRASSDVFAEDERGRAMRRLKVEAKTCFGRFFAGFEDEEETCTATIIS